MVKNSCLRPELRGWGITTYIIEVILLYISMTMKLMQKKSKQQPILKKQESEINFPSKKELAKLKSDYKSGKLNFDSQEVAKSLLNDFKKGLLE